MKLYSTETGSGETTLVFLHYFGGASSTWDEVINQVQNNFRCIAVDLLGFGKSPALNHPISVDDSTDAVVQLIENSDLKNVIIVGHSMGGKIAINTASRKLKHLLGLILLAPSPPTPEPMKESEREDMLTAFGKEERIKKMVQEVMATPVPDAVFLREVNNNLMTSQIGWQSWPELGSKEIIADRMKDVHVPISILYGENDRKFSKSFLQKEYGRYFSTFTLTEIKNSGHLLPAEAPEAVAAAIRERLNVE